MAWYLKDWKILSYPQVSHIQGFSLVWLLLCIASWDLDTSTLLQRSQGLTSFKLEYHLLVSCSRSKSCNLYCMYVCMYVWMYVCMYVCFIITVKRQDRSVPNFAQIHLGPKFFFLSLLPFSPFQISSLPPYSLLLDISLLPLLITPSPYFSLPHSQLLYSFPYSRLDITFPSNPHHPPYTFFP